MKNYLLVLAMVFLLIGSASAAPFIQIGDDMLWDVSTQLILNGDYWMIYDHPSNPKPEEISGWVNGGETLVEVYKQDVGGSESGLYALYYTANINEEGGTIVWDGPNWIDVNGTSAYLIVKDGNAVPSIYIFDLSGLGWDGRDTISLADFWPTNGGISHVSIYDPPTTIPEPATMFLLGSGLIGLAGMIRQRFSNR